MISNKKYNTVLVTGGTKGIGLAIAQSLVLDCHRLLITYRSDCERAVQAQKELNDLSPHTQIEVISADIADPKAASTLCGDFISRSIVPEVIVFNAGLTNRRSPFDLHDDEWYQVFEGNVHFPFKVMRQLSPHMSKGSVFMYIGSLMGIHPHSMSLSYGVTKSAVHSLITNMVKHLEPYGIRIGGIAPGFVDTEWQKNKPVEIRRSIESKIANHRFASPSEVAQVVKMMIDNDYFNGDIISMSGGYSYK